MSVAGNETSPPVDANSIDDVDTLLDRIFERMNHVDHQVTLIKTFCNINDIAGVARQLKFLSAHVTSATLVSQRIGELRNGGAE
ncbi:MAG: hypothetical protein WDN46_23225 [Methylocella sp.]